MRVTGRAVVERELAKLESRFAQHNAKLAKEVQRTASSTRAAGSRGGADPMFGPGRKEQMAAIKQRETAERQATARLARDKLRAERESTKAAQSLDRQRHRELIKHHNAEEREIRRKASVHAAEMGRMREENRKFTRSTIGNSAGRVMGGVAGVGRAGAAMVGLGGAALAATSISQAVQLDEMTRRLSIAGRGKGEAGLSPDQLRRQFTQTGIATGFAPEKIAAGAAAFTAKTGDLGTALKNQRVFSTVAQGAGAQVEEVFAAAADLSTKMDVSSVKDMSQAFAILSMQGKKGSFELKAMAGEFPEILASAASAGVRGISGVRDVGAVMQVARQASGSDSEASTAVQTMFRQLSARATDLQSGKALGGKKVQVFEGGDATKPMRNFVDVVGEVITQSGGNLTQMQDVFDVRGIKAINPMLTTFRNAKNEALQGGASKKDADIAGKSAMGAMFGDFRNVSADFAEVERDASDAMKSTSVQLEVLNTKLKEAIASSLFPALQRLVPEIERLVPQIGRAASAFVSLMTAFAQNPISGVGAIITASVMADMAQAGIGNAVRVALGSGIASMVAGGGLALALGIGAIQVGQMAVATMMVAAQKSVEDATQSGDAVRTKALEELQKGGRLSAETRNELERLKLTEEGTLKAGEAASKEGVLSVLGRGVNTINPFNDGTGTLEEGSKLIAATTNQGYRQGAVQTANLLGLDEMAKASVEGAQKVREILMAGATEAADKLKEGASEKPNRGDKPTGVKS